MKKIAKTETQKIVESIGRVLERKGLSKGWACRQLGIDRSTWTVWQNGSHDANITNYKKLLKLKVRLEK